MRWQRGVLGIHATWQQYAGKQKLECSNRALSAGVWQTQSAIVSQAGIRSTNFELRRKDIIELPIHAAAAMDRVPGSGKRLQPSNSDSLAMEPDVSALLFSSLCASIFHATWLACVLLLSAISLLRYVGTFSVFAGYWALALRRNFCAPLHCCSEFIFILNACRNHKVQWLAVIRFWVERWVCNVWFRKRNRWPSRSDHCQVLRLICGSLYIFLYFWGRQWPNCVIFIMVLSFQNLGYKNWTAKCRLASTAPRRRRGRALICNECGN